MKLTFHPVPGQRRHGLGLEIHDAQRMILRVLKKTSRKHRQSMWSLELHGDLQKPNVCPDGYARTAT